MALFVFSLCPFDISVGVGAFVIGLGQISSFLSSSIHIKILPNYLNVGVVPPCKEGDPYENDAFLSRTCLWLPLPE